MLITKCKIIIIQELLNNNLKNCNFVDNNKFKYKILINNYASQIILI